MKIKNPATFVLFNIFLFVNLADMVTSLFILKGEGNPLVLFGSPLVLYALKIIITVGIFLIIYKNKYPSRFMHYMIIVIMLFGSLALALGFKNNMQGIDNPELVEAAKQIPVNVRAQLYTRTITIIYLIPSALTLLAFKIYERSEKYVVITKNGT